MNFDDNDLYAQHFLVGLSEIHRDNPSQALILLFTVFSTSLSILSPEQRKKFILGFMIISKQIGDTVFEDGTDFLSFLQEITPNRILDELK